MPISHGILQAMKYVHFIIGMYICIGKNSTYRVQYYLQFQECTGGTTVVGILSYFFPQPQIMLMLLLLYTIQDNLEN